ncbi:hypothetical protein [Paracoccus binzhouensis]|uniref:hypothetical protein n=1 Tax=Paracoccus binzhouensis TaxID=2796149 RepID=UPI0018EF1A8A|nr:hypothetical protein [Paracoccus binzhouensis]
MPALILAWPGLASAFGTWQAAETVGPRRGLQNMVPPVGQWQGGIARSAGASESLFGYVDLEARISESVPVQDRSRTESAASRSRALIYAIWRGVGLLVINARDHAVKWRAHASWQPGEQRPVKALHDKEHLAIVKGVRDALLRIHLMRLGDLGSCLLPFRRKTGWFVLRLTSWFCAAHQILADPARSLATALALRWRSTAVRRCARLSVAAAPSPPDHR